MCGIFSTPKIDAGPTVAQAVDNREEEIEAARLAERKKASKRTGARQLFFQGNQRGVERDTDDNPFDVPKRTFF